LALLLWLVLLPSFIRINEIGIAWHLGKKLEDFKKGQKNWAGIPIVFLAMCERLEKGGLNDEGIFRTCGSAENVKKLKKAFNTKEAPKVDLSRETPEDVASLLKLWLRELPDPVIPYEFNQPIFQHAEQGQTKDVEQLKNLLKQMPQSHRLMLLKLLTIFSQVVRNNETTKMTPEAVSLAVGPSLIRDEKLDKELEKIKAKKKDEKSKDKDKDKKKDHDGKDKDKDKDKEEEEEEEEKETEEEKELKRREQELILANSHQIQTSMSFLILHQDELALADESTYNEKAHKKAVKEREKAEKKEKAKEKADHH